MANVKLMLKESVKNLGKVGELVNDDDDVGELARRRDALGRAAESLGQP